MNPLLITAFSKILANKHTSGAAIVYAAAKWGCPFLSTWFPQHEAQFKSTAEILEGAAVFYGFAAAGDAAKSATKEEVAVAIQTGDTSHLTKVDVPPQPPKT